MKSISRTIVLTTCLLAPWAASAQAAITEKAVVENYVTIAHAVFQDALTTAKTLQASVKALVEKPSQKALDNARQHWKQARVPYMQSEVFRFGNTIVDEWEGQLNAWPLDEGLIDYVSDSYQAQMGNEGGQLNIIANPVLEFAGEQLDLRELTPELLASMSEFAGSEANVTTGYHAVEFLLWGQDLNGTTAGAGQRPYTDFVQGAGCTHGHCDRRVAYLLAATQLLVDDLAQMEAQWAAGNKDNYRSSLLAQNSRDVLRKMLFGMGSLSLGELAGERMKVALEANSPEDEQDCFSDNTHYSHYYDGKGIENVYLGRYRRVDGSLIQGASLAELVRAQNKMLADRADKTFAITESTLKAMVDKAEAAENAMTFDMLIAEGNAEGKQLIANAIAALVGQTRVIEEMAAALGIENLSPDTADHSF